MTFAATETSVALGSPAELYEFVYENNYLRYTSAADPVTYNGNVFVPYPLKRAGIASQAASVDQMLEVMAFQDFPPAQLFRVQAPSAILNLTVRRRNLFDPDNEFIVIWIGRVLAVTWEEASQVKLQCESDLVSMKRLSLRRPYQLGCPYVLYGAGCNLSAANFAVNVTNFSAVGRAVTALALVTFKPNWFAGGYLTYSSTLTNIVEAFAIRSSLAGVLQLALTPFGLQTATEMTVYRGCDHTTTTCDTEFNNLDNFGGQPYIPDTNPFAGIALF